jgi:hypothetical protein
MILWSGFIALLTDVVWLNTGGYLEGRQPLECGSLEPLW